MPELPEVEMKRRFVEAHALGRRISAVTVLTPKILTKTTPEAFRRALEGAAFQAAPPPREMAICSRVLGNVVGAALRHDGPSGVWPDREA